MCSCRSFCLVFYMPFLCGIFALNSCNNPLFDCLFLRNGWQQRTGLSFQWFAVGNCWISLETDPEELSVFKSVQPHDHDCTNKQTKSNQMPQIYAGGHVPSIRQTHPCRPSELPTPTWGFYWPQPLSLLVARLCISIATNVRLVAKSRVELKKRLLFIVAIFNRVLPWSNMQRSYWIYPASNWCVWLTICSEDLVSIHTMWMVKPQPPRVCKCVSCHRSL